RHSPRIDVEHDCERGLESLPSFRSGVESDRITKGKFYRRLGLDKDGGIFVAENVYFNVDHGVFRDSPLFAAASAPEGICRLTHAVGECVLDIRDVFDTER